MQIFPTDKNDEMLLTPFWYTKKREEDKSLKLKNV